MRDGEKASEKYQRIAAVAEKCGSTIAPRKSGVHC